MSEAPNRFPGQIVLAWTDDGHENRQPHPAVIVTPKEDIAPGGPYRVVCVSTKIERPIPDHHVELPWQRPRHPKTGLNKPNVAKCDWPNTIVEADIIKDLGFVPAAQLEKISAALKRLDDGS